MANKLDKKIIEKILSHKSVSSSEGSIRAQISQIRGKNAGVTLPAAAHSFAKSKGFTLMRYLDDDDRKSLQYLKDTQKTDPVPKNKKIKKPKGITPSYGSNYVDAANENAKIYPHIYLIENSLREIIMETFKDEKDWWKNPKIVHQDIQDYSKKIHEAESKYKWMPARGDHPIFYIGLYELFKIIEKNWKLFKKVFGDLETLRTWIKEIVPIRNLIAHNVKARKEDADNARIKASHICTTIDRAKGEGQ